MEAHRFIAIPTSRKSLYFGQRLRVLALDAESARVQFPLPCGGTREGEIPRNTVNILADQGADNSF